MEVIRIEEKVNHLNSVEKYHIYRLCKQGTQLGNNCTDIRNTIFKEIYDISPGWP
jgi:hypothetical protein